MLLQTQSLTSHLPLIPLPPPKPIAKTHFFNPNPLRTPPRCSLSAVSDPTHLQNPTTKPFPAEVSRTILELVSVGTLSTLTQQGWPLGIGVRFAVDPQGTPVVCLDGSDRQLSIDRRSSLHVQLEQFGLRTPQCTILGSIDKPEDSKFLKYLRSVWRKRFGEEVDDDLLYVVDVDRVLQMEDFREVSEAKLVWIDRLGLDMRLWSPHNGIFEVRIPFPRDVTDEKGAKSMFNCMAQLAWEVEKNFHAPDFEKVKQVKQITKV